MTRPGSRSRRPSAAMAAAMSGAVDLSGLAERAKARAAAPADGGTGGGGGADGAVVVTEANFEAEVLQRSTVVPVVVLLGSPRSPVSGELAGTLERMAGADGGKWVLATIEVDSNVRIAQAFGVQVVPTVLAVAAGRPLADFQGDFAEPQLRQWIDAVLKAVEGKLSGPKAADDEPAPVEDPRFTAAEQALESGDFDAAQQAYQAVLAAEPDNADAKAALRQVVFLERAGVVAPDAPAVADAAPDDIPAALAAADAELLAQQPDAAFTRLIGLISRTKGDDRITVRTRLLELFELFDPADPVVVTARRKLATALY